MAIPVRPSGQLSLSERIAAEGVEEPRFFRKSLANDPLTIIFSPVSGLEEQVVEIDPEAPRIYVIDDHKELYDGLFANPFMDVSYVGIYVNLRNVHRLDFWADPSVKPRETDIVILDLNLKDAKDEDGTELDLPLSGVEILRLFDRNAQEGGPFQYLRRVLVASTHGSLLSGKHLHPDIALAKNFAVYTMEKGIDPLTAEGSVDDYTTRIPVMLANIYEGKEKHKNSQYRKP